MNHESNRRYYDSEAVAAGLRRDEVKPGEVRLAATLHGHPGWLLDLGCGSGRLHAHIERARLVGIDYAWAQLANYRHHVPEAKLVHATATRLPFAANTFDVVLMSYHVIESIIHASAREAALAEAVRVMHSSSRLFLTRHQRANYKLRQQVADRITGAAVHFGDLRGRGTSRSGGNDLSGFMMHVLSDREMQRLARKFCLTRVDVWDFDTGGPKRWTSRAVVETYRFRSSAE